MEHCTEALYFQVCAYLDIRKNDKQHMFRSSARNDPREGLRENKPTRRQSRRPTDHNQAHRIQMKSESDNEQGSSEARRRMSRHKTVHIAHLLNAHRLAHHVTWSRSLTIIRTEHHNHIHKRLDIARPTYIEWWSEHLNHMNRRQANNSKTILAGLDRHMK